MPSISFFSLINFQFMTTLSVIFDFLFAIIQPKVFTILLSKSIVYILFSLTKGGLVIVMTPFGGAVGSFSFFRELKSSSYIEPEEITCKIAFISTGLSVLNISLYSTAIPSGCAKEFSAKKKRKMVAIILIMFFIAYRFKKFICYFSSHS